MPTSSQRFSITFADTQVQRIREAIGVLQDELVPQLVSLGPEQRRGLPKMGDKTVSFVSKALDYARAHPHMRAPYVELDEFARAWETVELMFAMQRPLRLVTGLLDDSLLLAGSETYTAALACYQVVKGAARLKVPGAATVAADLGQRFPGRSKGFAVAPQQGDAAGQDAD
jgi:hypothetical protein